MTRYTVLKEKKLYAVKDMVANKTECLYYTREDAERMAKYLNRDGKKSA